VTRAEMAAPERISARVASRPKKTYAEDEQFGEGEDGMREGMGARRNTITTWAGAG